MLDIVAGYKAGKRDFVSANLEGANLREANLYGANLRGANLPHFQIPGGAIQGWKKLMDNLLAELTIPPEAKRTGSLIGRKCRAEYAYVSAIYNCQLLVPNGYSRHDGTEYVCGTVVRPDSYDDDIRVECSHGVHFFLTRQEAEEF